MLKIGALILVVVLAASVPVQAAPSQPPAPSAAKAAQSNVSANNKPAPNNGATNPGLVFSPEISTKTGERPHHSEDEAPKEYIGYILGAIGAVIALFTLLAIRKQAAIMDGTLGQMRTDAETRAREADRQLRISESAVKNAETQVATAFEQTDLAAKEHGLARLQFFAANRPKLEIRFAQRLRANPHIQASAKRLYVEFSVINTGTSAATITGSRVRLDWFYPDDVPNPDAMGGSDSIIPMRRLLVSARERCSLDVADAPPENSFNEGYSETPDSRLDQAMLLLLGWVVYQDERGAEFGDTRTTYFCRAYDRATERFAPVPGLSDWEFTH